MKRSKARALPRIVDKKVSQEKAHYYLMKFGLDRYYWLEYLFEAYVNHTPNIIFIRGLPDIDVMARHETRACR